MTTKRVIPGVGVHQRVNSAAYRIVSPFLAKETFPTLSTILHFEGINGPDGIKAKSPLNTGASHLYNPETEVGAIPSLIDHHYARLVDSIKKQDLVRSGFEAAWLAHYICDGLTPAHHFPLENRIAEHTSPDRKRARYSQPVVVKGLSSKDTIRKSWALWGGKGLLTTHFNFEIGVAATLVGHRIRTKLDIQKLARARAEGPVRFFKSEAKDVVQLRMYETFYEKGWNSKLARQVRNQLIPQSVQSVAIIWLLAYLEAGYDMAKNT